MMGKVKYSTTCLNICVYTLQPKYYHTSWLQALGHNGVVKSKAYQDPGVQASYMQALDKLVLMRSVIPYRNNLATTSMTTMFLGPTMQLEIEGIRLLSSGGTCMVVLLHSYNVWQCKCFHRW